MNIAYFKRQAIYIAIIDYSKAQYQHYDRSLVALRKRYLRQLLVTVMKRVQRKNRWYTFLRSPLNISKWRYVGLEQEEINALAQSINEMLLMSRADVVLDMDFSSFLSRKERQLLSMYYNEKGEIHDKVVHDTQELSTLVEMCDRMDGEFIGIDSETFELLKSYMPSDNKSDDRDNTPSKNNSGGGNDGDSHGEGGPEDSNSETKPETESKETNTFH